MMTEKDIIKRLRNDEDYYGDFGNQFMSNSDIGILLSNPEKFGEQREDTKVLLEGKVFHQLLLEPDKALAIPSVDVSTRTTKAYKEFLEVNKLDFALLTHELMELRDLSQKMLSNMEFCDIIMDPNNLYEEPVVGDIFNIAFKGKADIISQDFIDDIKTTADIMKFRRNAYFYHYDSQAFVYETLFKRRMRFLVIDKQTGQLGMFVCSNEFITSGREKVERALAVYATYFGDNAPKDIRDHFISDIL